ncbi:MAG: DMT family transporter, partial [Anaerolineae bacterium]|nr:DMT family transporter [Anaerolineae bacterium]
MDFAGHIAALLAASSFSITSTLFALSGRYFRPSLVMQGSLPMGMICLFWLHWLVTGHPVPVDMNNQRLLLLGGSGIIGFWLGSIALVNALIRLGPRLALLIGATGPILSTLLAWIFLGEVLDATAVLGIMTTMGGIAWVVSENGDGQKMAQPADYRAGIIFALMAAVGQAISFLLSKEGLSGDFDPLSASL